MNIVMIHGQNHKGSTYHLGMLLTKQLGGTVTEFFLPKDFGEFCTGCTNCITKSETSCPPFYTNKADNSGNGYGRRADSHQSGLCISCHRCNESFFGSLCLLLDGTSPCTVHVLQTGGLHRNGSRRRHEIHIAGYGAQFVLLGCSQNLSIRRSSSCNSMGTNSQKTAGKICKAYGSIGTPHCKASREGEAVLENKGGFLCHAHCAKKRLV